MTSKEQERKALEQIRKIVEGLGEDSYVGKAFEGCFEFAEDNINNDFWMSMKERKEAAEFAEDELRLKIGEKLEQIKSLETKIDNLQISMAERDKALDTKDYRIAELSESLKKVSSYCTENWNKLQAAETKLDEKEDEIVRLKAKLYDLMVK